ncbi:hypothetical protein PG997_014633 [Apiospora hydei]|uniref:Uncharacterized protein n=1 Tax=Apiospora hydei TaxID=1337664 RepID=A0ABR1UUD0_9PEZI
MASVILYWCIDVRVHKAVCISQSQGTIYRCNEVEMVHNKGLGYSSSDLTPEEIAAKLQTQQESEIALDILTNCTLGFVKLSALFSTVGYSAPLRNEAFSTSSYGYRWL